MQNSDILGSRRRAQLPKNVSPLYRLLFLGGVFLITPAGLHAQVEVVEVIDMGRAKLTAADSAACAAASATIKSYVSRHPDVTRELEQMKGIDTSLAAVHIPDTAQASAMAALGRGQIDSATAILRRAIPDGSDPKVKRALSAITALSALPALLTSLPDTVRTSLSVMFAHRCQD